MKIARRFTSPNKNPLDEVVYAKRASKIKERDGSIVFAMDNVEVPESWSQLATDIAVSKYFRKSGVQQADGTLGTETSVRQLVERVAKTIRESGEQQGGYFDSTAEAQAFEDELSHMLVNQIGAFNSPVWFNCGLHRYGIDGTGGNWAWNAATDKIEETTDAYTRPQCSACFIQSVDDDLMSIFELVKNEARLFKYGSGTGTNFSRLRSRFEHLSGGGTSSGLMSFLKVLDAGAGATKSGGTTRRAAKMVILDVDHPEIDDFINWKVKEETKAKALIAAGYDSDFNGEAYQTVGGQNSNNSVRVNDGYMNAVEEGREWKSTFRTRPDTVHKMFKADDLFNRICEAAWSCADPGLQFDTTINDWHTCPNTDRINASNPCSEYMFLDDSACNLASVNLVKFLSDDGTFDIEGYAHACRIFLLAQEIVVDLASYPTKQIAQNSHDYRPLGLGYANLGALLTRLGLPYDSDAGRTVAGALTAIMCGQAYAMSALAAKDKGPFPGYAKNASPFLRVMRKHRDAAYRLAYDNTRFTSLIDAARESWDLAVNLGEHHGYRNAQATVLAPTGTIGLLMDCDTTGIEPDFAIVKFKKLAGGGSFKIVNNSVAPALKSLGYTANQVDDIITYIVGTNTLVEAPFINRAVLIQKGFTDEDLDKVEKALPAAFELAKAFMPHVLGDEALERLGFTKKEWTAPGFNLLKAVGFTNREIAAADEIICGRLTIEGAPHIKAEHLPIFDCANRCGKTGRRFIAPMGHVKMMAATQPFISGAISKTVNLPNEATVEDIRDIYIQSWKLGLKAIALYRDGCKASQPLNTKASDEKADEKTAEAPAVAAIAAAPVAAAAVASGPAVPVVSQLASDRSLSTTPIKGQRHRLPVRRKGMTIEGKVAGHKVYIRTGDYPSGELGEIFIDMHKEGAAFRSLMNCFAISVSLGLQYGVPLETFVDTFTFTRFEPFGVVDHPNVKMSTSIIDYVFRVLGLEYLNRTDLVQVKPEDLSTEEQGERFAESLAASATASTIASAAVVATPVAPVGAIVASNANASTNGAIPGGYTNGGNGGYSASSASSGYEGGGLGGGGLGGGLQSAVSPTAYVAPQVVSEEVARRANAELQDAMIRSVMTDLNRPKTYEETLAAPAPYGTGEAYAAANQHAGQDAMDSLLGTMMGDAPMCDVCGHITVRNGACYKCMNCGNSMGCS